MRKGLEILPVQNRERENTGRALSITFGAVLWRRREKRARRGRISIRSNERNEKRTGRGKKQEA